MIVNKVGMYKLLEQFSVRQSCAITQLSAGTIINITQIDKQGRKVIGRPEICDWVDWDMPVEPVKEDKG
jgi:hypothetical protein